MKDWAPGSLGGAALMALPFVYQEPYPLHIMVIILIWAFVYTSWSVMGRFGLVSLGHGGFFGIGAYVHRVAVELFRMSRPGSAFRWRCSPPSIVALVIAYPCSRFRIIGHYFALVTLALSAIVLQVITATRDTTGGSLGYTPQQLPWRQLDLCVAVHRQADLVPDRAGRSGRWGC